MKYAVVFITLCLLTSCSFKTIPLKGQYQETPFVFKTDKPISKVWDNLIDFFAQSGIGIKIIDRSSGLIISEDFSFKGMYTTENKKGIANRPHVYLITSMVRTPTSNDPMYPSKIIGNWNVRLKEQDGQTLVNVNITNIKAYDMTSTTAESTQYTIKSLGNFERKIFETIK